MLIARVSAGKYDIVYVVTVPGTQDEFVTIQMLVTGFFVRELNIDASALEGIIRGLQQAVHLREQSHVEAAEYLSQLRKTVS